MNILEKIDNVLEKELLNEAATNIAHAKKLVDKIKNQVEDFMAQSEMFADENPRYKSDHVQLDKSLGNFIHFVKKVANNMDKENYGI